MFRSGHLVLPTHMNLVAPRAVLLTENICLVFVGKQTIVTNPRSCATIMIANTNAMNGGFPRVVQKLAKLSVRPERSFGSVYAKTNGGRYLVM